MSMALGAIASVFLLFYLPGVVLGSWAAWVVGHLTQIVVQFLLVFV